MTELTLAEFIEQNHPAIVAEWQEFAGTLAPAATEMDAGGLRDHAEEILSTVVRDMRSRETNLEQAAKSKGQGRARRLAHIGELHAKLRLESGFKLDQVVSEYRALRASVLRLWGSVGTDPEGVMRFNESIDEALSVAVAHFTETADHYRDQSLAILAHDLRNPLSGIIMGTAMLVESSELGERSSAVASRMLSSANRMKRMIDDLLDLTRTRFGDAIPIVRAPMDLEPLCRQLVAELERLHPGGVRLSAAGDLRGEWHGDRVAQLLSNLLRNAIQHGSTRDPIDVIARGERDEVVLAVRNRGPAIPPGALRDIFEPSVHRSSGDRADEGLGLGLYIASQIAIAHGGSLDVVSNDAEGTTFTARLPRRSAEKQPRSSPGATASA